MVGLIFNPAGCVATVEKSLMGNQFHHWWPGYEYWFTFHLRRPLSYKMAPKREKTLASRVHSFEFGAFRTIEAVRWYSIKLGYLRVDRTAVHPPYHCSKQCSLAWSHPAITWRPRYQSRLQVESAIWDLATTTRQTTQQLEWFNSSCNNRRIIIDTFKCVLKRDMLSSHWNELLPEKKLCLFGWHFINQLKFPLINIT